MDLGNFPDPGVHRGAHFAHFRSVSVYLYMRIVPSGRPGSFRIGSHQSVHCPADNHPSPRSRAHRRLQQHIPLAGILPQIRHQRPAPPTSGGQRVAISAYFGKTSGGRIGHFLRAAGRAGGQNQSGYFQVASGRFQLQVTRHQPRHPERPSDGHRRPRRQR